MVTEFSFGMVMLLIIYLMLVVASAYASLLYYIACKEMKRTRMIKSVLFLLLAILFENLYFFIKAMSIEHGIWISTILANPWVWSIPKGFKLFGVVYFIYASLMPESKKVIKSCEEVNEIPQHLKKNNK